MPPTPSKPTPKQKLTPEQEALLGEPDAVPAADPLATIGADAAPAMAAPAPELPPRWRVKKTKVASYYGQIVTMVEGDILLESSYGPEGLRRLRDSGVELEKV